MNPVGPESTALPDIFENLDQQGVPQEAYVADMSQAMWNYRNRGTFEGMPVSEDARNLLVKNTQQLHRALQPKGQAGVWTGYISPAEQDKVYLQEYTQLIQKETNGQIYILQQQVQFCPSINKFLAFITYMNIELGLNPRYEHLKEENNVQQ